MPKIITSQLQATGTSQVFTLPTVAPATGNGLLQTNPSGLLTFTGSPSITSLNASGAVTANSVSAPTVSGTTLVAPYVKSTPTSATFTLPTTDGTSGSVLTTNGSGVLSFQNVTISLYGAVNPTVSTVANPGVVYMNTVTYEYFVCGGSRPNPSGSGTWYLWIGSQGTYIGFPQGQTAYTSGPGTYSFVVPSYVSSLSAVVVGGGGGGSPTWSNSAGGGGALAYATFAVTPGETITVIVGAGGTPTGSGGYSYIRRGGTNLFYAQGGLYNVTGSASRASPVSGTVTCYGGQGGICSSSGYGGGGGAGGYGSSTSGSDAQGGDGCYGYNGSGAANGSGGSNGSGGGGVGYPSSTYGFGGGGGVGLLGRGSSAAVNQTNVGNTFYQYYGGYGGSGGEGAAGNTNGTQTLNGRTMYSGEGGRFGGGGGGSGTSLSNNSSFCVGGYGGARIIWGAGRAYPATNTADVTPVS